MDKDKKDVKNYNEKQQGEKREEKRRAEDKPDRSVKDPEVRKCKNNLYNNKYA